MKNKLAFSAILCGALSAQTPWVSYTATYKQHTRVTAPNGDVLSDREAVGTKMRSSTGDQMLIKDKSGVAHGTFWQASSGKVFEVSYFEKRATLSQGGSGPLAHRTHKGPAIGTKVVQGILLTAYVIRNGEQVVGTMWVSLPNDLEVQIEMRNKRADGTETWSTFELVDIQFGQEPPHQQCTIPSDFEVLDRVQ